MPGDTFQLIFGGGFLPKVETVVSQTIQSRNMVASKLVLDGKLFCIADDTISCLVRGGVWSLCQYELALALPARVLRCRC